MRGRLGRECRDSWGGSMQGGSKFNAGKIIGLMSQPLRFYALALLIVESFLASILAFSELSEGLRFCGMLIGVALFILVLSIVTFLVWYRIENLIFEEDAHLKATIIKSFKDVPIDLIAVAKKEEGSG